jgi:hypothetical protein
MTNRLMTLLHRGAAAPELGRRIMASRNGAIVHRYSVDEGEEHLLWVETQGGGFEEMKENLPTGEIFTFDLARDVGVPATSPPPWLYIVHTDIPANVVDDYNAWYDQEHLPRLVTVPGVDRARRYVATGELRPRYLTAYDLSIKDAFESPQGLVARKTPWTERMRSLFRNTRRKMCTLQT